MSLIFVFLQARRRSQLDRDTVPSSSFSSQIAQAARTALLKRRERHTCTLRQSSIMAIYTIERNETQSGSPIVRRITVGKMRSKRMMWDVRGVAAIDGDIDQPATPTDPRCGQAAVPGPSTSLVTVSSPVCMRDVRFKDNPRS